MTLRHELEAADPGAIREVMVELLAGRNHEFFLRELQKAKQYRLLGGIADAFDSIVESLDAAGKPREDLINMTAGLSLALVSISAYCDLQAPDFPPPTQ